jgi:3-deoxy-7-phosphoheptulonate synthase
MSLGLRSEVVQSSGRTLIAIADDASTLPAHFFSQLDDVEKVINISSRYPLVLSTGDKQGMTAAGLKFGGERPVVIAGPCSVESTEQVMEVAHAVKKAGACALRGGAFKPRTSPYDFCGLGFDALKILAEARRETGLPIVSEVMSASQIELGFDYIDILQIGARNMYNYELLREAGRTKKPVLLKRAMSATIDEFLQAAEYVLLEGNEQVILCERGIRTFETKTRNTLDLNAAALLKRMTNLPIIVDPSHGTGRSELVQPLAQAAIACGADGLMIETHCHPAKSFSDAEQAITPEELSHIIDRVRAIARILRSDDQIGSCTVSGAQPAFAS